MDTRKKELWKIVEKAGQSRPLSHDELNFVEGCLSAPEPGDQANACEVIFRASDSARVRSVALSRLESLCGSAAEEDYKVTLLTVLLYVPVNDITNRPALRGFAFRSALSSRWAIRTNAVAVLERIAHQGDGEALHRIQELAEDADNYVQANARSSLGRLIQ